MKRTNYATNTPWEPIVGYSRATRIGQYVCVSGTTSTDESGNVIGENPYEQTVQIIRNLEKALAALGASLSDVIRTRTFVVNMDDWEQIGRAHGEFFGSIRPATSMVQVSRLISPKMLLEIEADAVVGD
jgi:enamine deaminase RidA (YjgF/YER057c/UK114 family)